MQERIGETEGRALEMENRPMDNRDAGSLNIDSDVLTAKYHGLGVVAASSPMCGHEQNEARGMRDPQNTLRYSTFILVGIGWNKCTSLHCHHYRTGACSIVMSACSTVMSM